MPMKQRIWLTMTLMGCLALIGLGTWRYNLLLHNAPLSTPRLASQSPPKSLIFTALGDQLAHDSVIAQARTVSGYDFTAYYQSIRQFTTSSDVVFCNPETVSAGESFGISGYPVFNAPPEYARGLRDEVRGPGCNLINLASNHVNDKGQEALNANVALWESLKPLGMSGSNRSAQDQEKVSYFIKKGLKVAFVAFADYSNDTNLTPYALNSYHDDALLVKLVKEARQHADVVIVSMHWGTEGMTRPNDDQLAAARRLTDMGVDVILGTGPHVLQNVTWLSRPDGHKTLVWYSLGNTLSAQLKIDELTGGVAGFRVTKTAEGVRIDQITFRPTFMSYDWAEAEKTTENLAARSNFQLRPLAEANSDISRMFGPQHMASERRQFVTNVLTADTSVKILP